ncbi:MAG: hypothetical protein GY811_26465 [Myxococcales bacterium]|nr:hypothetical protein [Myxococcales bacterium]
MGTDRCQVPPGGHHSSQRGSAATRALRCHSQSYTQSNPVTYPFTSYNGDVTFTPPTLGERSVDFNTEGMLHIGLLPGLIEDARRDGVTDEELEPLFRSAEGYIRMWERAESRSREF